MSRKEEEVCLHNGQNTHDLADSLRRQEKNIESIVEKTWQMTHNCDTKKERILNKTETLC